MEIQVKESGTGIHKTIREINLVYIGLNQKCPIPISHHVTPHFSMCGNFHHHEHRCASGVGAPPLDTQPLQGIYRFCGRQNGLTTAPKIFNRVCYSQTCRVDLLQAFNRIGGSQIMYDNPPQTFKRLRCRDDISLQAFNYLTSCQNLPVEHLEGLNRFCGRQNWLSKQLQAFN